MGHVEKERTVSLISGSDILIQPSLVEGISSTLLEAMACKTPIITTNIGGNNELLENNKSGIMIEPNSPQKILEKLIELLSDRQKSINLSEEAFNKVQKYDWSHVGKLYLNIYESLLQ